MSGPNGSAVLRLGAQQQGVQSSSHYKFRGGVVGPGAP